MLREKHIVLFNRVETIRECCDKIIERIDDMENELERRIEGNYEDLVQVEEKLANLKLQVEGLSLLLSKKEVKEFLDTLTAE